MSITMTWAARRKWEPPERLPRATDPAAEAETTLPPRLDLSRAPAVGPVVPPTWVWDLPLAPVTYDQTIDLIDAMVRDRRPRAVITANLNYAMLAERSPDVRRAARRAGLVVADGMPLVWASRLAKAPLPERVAGSDLIYDVCDLARNRNYRIFFLGGAEGVAGRAAFRLTRFYPGLKIAGTFSPPFGAWNAAQTREVIAKIRDARPDILFGAFGQPRGELLFCEHVEAFGVPVCLQLGASIDFAAGRARRAPGWMRGVGLEWWFRLAREPKRMIRRYGANAAFLARMSLRGRRGLRVPNEIGEPEAVFKPPDPIGEP